MSSSPLTESRVKCPRCGKKLRMKKEGIFQWKVCTKACGWTVYTHGEDKRDKKNA